MLAIERQNGLIIEYAKESVNLVYCKGNYIFCADPRKAINLFWVTYHF
jgi:hypothetical protein